MEGEGRRRQDDKLKDRERRGERRKWRKRGEETQ